MGATHSVRLGAFRVAYADYGPRDAPAVVLLHGLGSSRLSWSRNIDTLAARYRTIAVDLPGFGRSSKPRYAYSMTFFATKVEQLLLRLKVREAVWVGHSMGAQVAITQAIHGKLAPRALALLAPAGFETFTEMERKWLENAVSERWVRSRSPQEIRDQLALAFHRMPVQAETLLEFRNNLRGVELEGYACAFANSVKAMLREPIASQLPNMRVPTLVLVGDRDRLIPNQYFNRAEGLPQLAAQTVAAMPRAKLVVLPNAGHLLHFEQPAAFARAISPFLSQHLNVASQQKVG